MHTWLDAHPVGASISRRTYGAPSMMRGRSTSTDLHVPSKNIVLLENAHKAPLAAAATLADMPPPPPPLSSSVSIGQNPMAYQLAAAPPTTSHSARAARKMSPAGPVRSIRSISSSEERERIRDFWIALGKDRHRDLVKVEKGVLWRKLKEQQWKGVRCSCVICGRKRDAIEEEFQVLYDAYHEDLEQYALHQQHSNYTPTLLPGSGPFPGFVEINSYGAVGFPPAVPHTKPSFASDMEEDPLKNDWCSFLKMIEDSMQQRIERGEAVQEMEEEDRRMFAIFAARMFEERVLQMYREHVAQERQQLLLREIEDEDKLKREKVAKKQAQNEKKKNKKRQQRQAKARKAAQLAAEKPKQATMEEQGKRREEERVRREAVPKTQDFLPTLIAYLIARWRKEKANPGATTVLPEDLVKDPAYSKTVRKGAALLLLPSYFSTPNVVTRTLPSGLSKSIGLLSVASNLEDATSDSDYEIVQKQVQEEWLKVGGLLVGLAALETAAFALAPGISTGAGLLCDACLLLRFSLASVPVFKHRAQDTYEVHENGSISRTESYIFFAFIARLPLLLGWYLFFS
ncbi:salt tolerance down-regulator-domain-containing protein [Mycena albidolilacea]|uniref:Stress response protein NST1 n=1 Tax=Mycena albidolilacea TaxID=1033008 RepID=A0AAD7ACH0_9AGAR|nr:salt tolerance down-regulator-domain-containing protein [Mycena albidolilacea]